MITHAWGLVNAYQISAPNVSGDVEQAIENNTKTIVIAIQVKYPFKSEL